VVTKLDTKGGKPNQVWRFDPAPDRDYATTVACCGINNRGAVLAGNMVISIVIDGRVVALNKETGAKVWEAQVADPGIGETITGAPLIVKDMVVTGMAGAEFGVRGWLEAMDLQTGKRRWRTHTIPGPGEPGHETWKDDYGAWKTGGGSTWVTGSYDPETNLIVWGTANPGPDWDAAYRPGDNLWTDSTIALDADTGKIVWGFQHTPNDPYDYDSIAENTFVDTTIGGKKVKMTLHSNVCQGDCRRTRQCDQGARRGRRRARAGPHGREELAADELQPPHQLLLHPGDRRLQQGVCRGHGSRRPQAAPAVPRWRTVHDL
jgi:alcohol dehydrogenase (cytochrome c)